MAEELEPGADQEALRAYRQEKLRVAECLLGVLHIAEARGDDRRVELLRQLAARLAEDRFQLAVVGQFSRGKSTLMNAILGGPYLPTGALPMTSVITNVTYGSRARVTIRRRGDLLPLETSLEDLGRYVAQASEDREELRVASASIELPAEILRLGFAFVDTPGVGSAVVANSETTLGFLPQADAVIFVTSFDSPFTEAERSFLHDVCRQVKRIFVVLNKRDLVEDAEAAAVEAYVRQGLRDAGVEEPALFALSAREGLVAKCEGDPGALVASGLRDFEAALIDYLTTEKTKEFLLRAVEHTEHFVTAFRAEVGLASRLAEDPGGRARAERLLRQTPDQLERSRRAALESIRESATTQAEQLPPGGAAALVAQVVGTVEVDPPAGRSVDLRTQAEGIEARSRERALAWSRETMSSWCRAIERSNEARLIELDRIPGDLERAVAGPLDLPVVTEPADLERDRPHLEPTLPSWSVALRGPHLAWSRTRASAVLREAMEAAAERHVAQLGERLRSAASDWMTTLDGWSFARLQERATAMRNRIVGSPDPALTGELQTLEDSLLASRTRVESWTVPAGIERELVVPASSPGTPERDASVGCVVCAGLIKALFEFMAHYQFDLATRLGTRRIHAVGKGFCPKHTWYYADIGSPVGISGSYAQLAEVTADALLRAAEEASGPAALRAVLQGAHSTGLDCPACLRLEVVGEELVADLRRQLEQPATVPLAVPGLCVDHAAKLLDDDLDPEVARRVVVVTANRLQRRAEDMRTFSLKRESRRRGLVDKEEEAAYRDVLVRLAGHPLLAGMPANKDDEISMATPSSRQ